MAKKEIINVEGVEITFFPQQKNNENYICLTDIARYRNTLEPFSIINNWMRSRSTIEFIGLWEILNNPDFKPLEFDRFKTEAINNKIILQKKKIIDIKNPIKKTKSCENATCRVSIRENKNNIVNVKFMRFYKNLTSNKCKNNQI